MQAQGQTDAPITVADPLSLVDTFRTEIKGAVVPDPKVYVSPCVAADLAGLDDLVIATPELAARLRLPIKADLRGKFKDDADALRYVRTTLLPRLNPYLSLCLDPPLDTGAVDQIIAARGMAFWITGPKAQDRAGRGRGGGAGGDQGDVRPDAAERGRARLLVARRRRRAGRGAGRLARLALRQGDDGQRLRRQLLGPERRPDAVAAAEAAPGARRRWTARRSTSRSPCPTATTSAPGAATSGTISGSAARHVPRRLGHGADADRRRADDGAGGTTSTPRPTTSSSATCRASATCTRPTGRRR